MSEDKDIFISYSTKDTEIAEKACNHLEDNGFACWMAPRDIKTSANYAEEIMDALENVKLVVLILSESSSVSPYVLEEIDKTYNRDKPILPFRIDDVNPDGSMGFYLMHYQWLDASSNPESFFDKMVADSRRLIALAGAPPVPPEIPDHHRSPEPPEPPKPGYLKYKVPIVLAVILVVAVGGFLLFGGLGNDGNNADENGIVIDYIGMDDDSSKGYSWKYSYFVFGTVHSNLTNSSDDVVHIDFLDESGKVIESNDTKISDIEGNVLASAYVDDDDVEKVVVELRSTGDNVLYSTQSDNIIKQ